MRRPVGPADDGPPRGPTRRSPVPAVIAAAVLVVVCAGLAVALNGGQEGAPTNPAPRR